MMLGSSGTDMSIIKHDFSSLLCTIMSDLFANISLSVNMVVTHKVPFLIFIAF